MSTTTRPAAIEDAILGVRPRFVHSPATIEECAEVIAESGREKHRLAFLGGGTEIDLGAPPAALDAVVRTDGIARVVEYAPADMVIVAEAGTTLAEIQRVAAAEKQRLALDPPRADRATIGGLVATGAYGPRRARFGAIRDLIIGVTLIRADGVVARGGGKVVKNVAGFDLPKIACGSLGTLGMIASATFRLHPLPEMTSTVLFDRLTAEGVLAMVKAIREAQLEPSSAVALRNGSGAYELAIRFEGFGKGVTQQVERLLAMQRAAGRGQEHGSCHALETSEAEAFWQRHDDVRSVDGGRRSDPASHSDLRPRASDLRVRLATLPSHIADIDRTIAPLLASLGQPSFAWYATLGIGFISGEPSEATTAALIAARQSLVGSGGSLIIEAAPPAVRSGVDVWGPVTNAFPIMEALKLRFDPDRRLNPGRFAGGL